MNLKFKRHFQFKAWEENFVKVIVLRTRYEGTKISPDADKLHSKT